MVFNLIIISLLLVVSGIAKAVMDTCADHYPVSLFKRLGWNQSYWDKKSSSNNKYKNGDKLQGPKYFLSTTILVWTTDAWHLFQMIFLTTFSLAFLLTGYLFNADFIGLIVIYVTCNVVMRMVFEFFYSEILV